MFVVILFWSMWVCGFWYVYKRFLQHGVWYIFPCWIYVVAALVCRSWLFKNHRSLGDILTLWGYLCCCGNVWQDIWLLHFTSLSTFITFSGSHYMIRLHEWCSDPLLPILSAWCDVQETWISTRTAEGKREMPRLYLMLVFWASRYGADAPHIRGQRVKHICANGSNFGWDISWVVVLEGVCLLVTGL